MKEINNKQTYQSFDEAVPTIQTQLNKWQGKWRLTAISGWFDFDDVKQIIFAHIYKKFHLYKSDMPFVPWCNMLISNQIKNLIRNNYGSFSRPCLKCVFAEGEDGCTKFEKQTSECPLYANWIKTKKSAHDTKLPVSLELHSQEVYDMTDNSIDIEKTAKNIHIKMQQLLKPFEWRIYKYLYIENKTDEEIGRLMNYKTTEKGRSGGYKTLANIKKLIITKVKKCLNEGEFEIVN